MCAPETHAEIVLLNLVRQYYMPIQTDLQHHLLTSYISDQRCIIDPF